MAGYLDGGFEAWEKANEPIDLIVEVEADEMAMDIPFDDHMVILDVRGQTEYADGHVEGAVNLPLDEMMDPASMANIKDNDNVYVHCAGVIAALSLLHY
jgi:rhodanese-related sulfurtransferase